MILYEKDFHEQGAIADTETKNYSFIRIAKLLKDMGIKNHKFMLALYDKELQGVNPHNVQDDSNELHLRIARECKMNWWYYVRECVNVPSQGTLNSGYFIASRANIALSWVFMNNIKAFLTMPRQLGKTWTVVALTSYIYLIIGQRVDIGLFAKGTYLVQENVSRLKTLRDGLPPYLIDKKPSDTENKEGLSYTKLENEYKTFVPPTSQRAASGLASGESFAFVHWDELPEFQHNYLAWPNVVSTTSTAQPNARKAGIPAANLITTTASMLDSKEGKYAHDIKAGALRFRETFYDSENKNEVTEALSQNSVNDTFYLEYSHSQLGMSDAWLEERRRQVNDPVKFATDYLNKWLHGSGRPILPQHVLDRLHACKIEPLSCTMFHSLILRWYVDPETVKDKPIVFGGDTSDMVGRDFTTLVGVDPTDMSTVVTINCNVGNLTYVAQCIMKLLQDYPNSIFIPERNENGSALIDIILASMKASDNDINPWTRIFNTVVQNWGDKKSQNIDIQRTDPTDSVLKKHFGFWTSASNKSRKFLFKNVLMTDAQKNTERIYDADIIDQINTLTIKNGRVDHISGEHDDVLIARLLAAWLILFGRNLSMYGLNPQHVMSEVSDSGDKMDPAQKQQQKEYKQRIKQLDEWLEDATIPEPIKRHHRNERNHLAKFIEEDESMDESTLAFSKVTDQKEEEKKQRRQIHGGFNNERTVNLLSRSL